METVMNGWVVVGNRYVNLANVNEVIIDDRLRIARLFFVGGGTVELREDDARDLQTALGRIATDIVDPHRTVFVMPDA
jgi:hypothetical protein